MSAKIFQFVHPTREFVNGEWREKNTHPYMVWHDGEIVCYCRSHDDAVNVIIKQGFALRDCRILFDNPDPDVYLEVEFEPE